MFWVLVNKLSKLVLFSEEEVSLDTRERSISRICSDMFFERSDMVASEGPPKTGPVETVVGETRETMCFLCNSVDQLTIGLEEDGYISKGETTFPCEHAHRNC